MHDRGKEGSHEIDRSIFTAFIGSNSTEEDRADSVAVLAI